MKPPVVAIFGPTGAGKTGVTVELARMLAGRGKSAVAINCDSMQIYDGLGIISGAPDPADLEALEHRLLAMVPIDQEFSAGRYAELAQAEIDKLLDHGTWPLVVGGTGLYLRSALSAMELRPPVPAEIREQVELDLERDGPEALHAALPSRFREWVAAGDRKRIMRITELLRAGHEPAGDSGRGGDLWTRSLRHRTLLIGLTMDDQALTERISARVEAMAAAGAGEEAEAALAAGASRTVRAAIGFEQFRTGDLERVKILHRRYGRRQLTWMRRMEGVTRLDRTGLTDRDVAGRILELAQSLDW